MKKKVITVLLTSIMALVIGTTAFGASGTWQYDGYGWWYSYDSSSYASSCWENIDGTWYHFNSSGYMDTGWLWDGAWYYLNADGSMHTGWLWDGAWYYMTPEGTMAAGWINDGNNWYYMSAYGTMYTGWLWDGAWYYLNPDGSVHTGWLWDGAWYYMGSSGVMQTGWVQDQNNWYYLLGSGVMAVGDVVVDGVTQSFGADGVWLGNSSAEGLNTYWVVGDGFTIPEDGIEGYKTGTPQYSCWVFANEMYSKIWGTMYNGAPDTSDDMLGMVSSSECLVTAANAKKYLTQAKPGAVVRVSDVPDEYYDSGDTAYMHSFILLGASDTGCTVYHGNWGWDTPHISINTFTWEDLVYWMTSQNTVTTYFKYIKWPQANPNPVYK